MQRYCRIDFKFRNLLKKVSVNGPNPPKKCMNIVVIFIFLFFSRTICDGDSTKLYCIKTYTTFFAGRQEA